MKKNPYYTKKNVRKKEYKIMTQNEEKEQYQAGINGDQTYL